MPRGAFRWAPAILSLLPFSLLAYLLVDGGGGVLIKALLIGVFALLALRASGLRSTQAETDAEAGHLSFRTEFESEGSDSTDESS